MTAQFSIKDGRSWKVPFFTIWGGQAFSILGSQLVQFALVWYLTVQTGSAIVLATASMAGMLPNVILGPFVGALVDRWNRRRIMIISDSLIALATVLLAVLFALGVVEIWHIYALLFIRSLGSTFHGNAMNASTALLVPVEHLTRVQGFNQMLNGGLNIVSAPLGALLLNYLPLQGVLAIDVSSALVAIVPLFFFNIPQPERPNSPDQKTTVWIDFKQGLQYILGWRGLMIIGLMTVGINFTILPAFSLLPLLVKNYFGGNAAQLSMVEASMGIGVFLGGALLGVWGGFDRKIKTSMIGLAGMGAGTLILALAPSSSLYLAIAGALLAGLMEPITMGPFFAIIQANVEPEMQARVFALMTCVGTAIAPIGLMVAGPIAEQFGIQVWFFVGGGLCILMALLGLCVPAVMNIEEQRSIGIRNLERVSQKAG